MKAVVAAFNQEKALVGAFSVITNLRMELFEALETGAFNGVVGRVGRAEADVGISIISYTSERQEVVDYSHGNTSCVMCHVSRVTCHVSRVRYRGGRDELDLEAPWQAAAQHQHRADIRPLLLDHDRLLPGRSQVGAV